MSVPFWVHELAAAFWAEAGEEEGFPRSLRRAIARALPLTVVSLPRLRVAGVDGWLLKRGIPVGVEAPDRPLRACLVAHRGHGVVFLDGTDPGDEQRFSLAHELAHFLREYWQPRRLAAGRFGFGVLEVFDGTRPPSPEERVHSLLARVPIGFQIHLMERAEDGRAADSTIDEAECGADRLAFELLAPSDMVLRDVEFVPPERRRRVARRALVERYGFPVEQAARYASYLLPASAPADSLVRRLRLVT